MHDGVSEATGRPPVRRGLGRGLEAILPARGLPYLPPGRAAGSLLGPDEPPQVAPQAGMGPLVARIDAVLDEARLEGSSVAVVVFGVDGFRHVNATYGHDAGDAVLGALAERICRSRRAGDVAGRLRGDEFVVVCPRASTEPDRMMARLSAEIEQPLSVAGEAYRLRATLGVAVTQPGAPRCTARSLLGEADLAMHRAKDAGLRWAGAGPVETPPRPPVPPEPHGLRYRPLVHVDSRLVTGARVAGGPVDGRLGETVDRVLGDIERWQQAAGLPSGFRVWLDEASNAPVEEGTPTRLARLLSLRDALGQAGTSDGDSAPGSRFGVVLRGVAPGGTEPESELRAALTSLAGLGVAVAIALDDVPSRGHSPTLDLPVCALWIPAALALRRDRTHGVAALARVGRRDLDVVVEGVDSEQLSHMLPIAGATHAIGPHYGGPLSSERFAGLLWASVGAHHAARWNTSPTGRLGRPAETDRRSSSAARPRSTAPT